MGLDATARRAAFFGDTRADWWHVPVLPGLQCVAAGVPGALPRLSLPGDGDAAAAARGLGGRVVLTTIFALGAWAVPDHAVHALSALAGEGVQVLRAARRRPVITRLGARRRRSAASRAGR